MAPTRDEVLGTSTTDSGWSPPGEPWGRGAIEAIRRKAVLDTLRAMGVQVEDVDGLTSDGILIALRDRSNWRPAGFTSGEGF